MSSGCVDDTMRAGARVVDAIGGRRGGRPALGPRPGMTGPWYVRPRRAKTGSEDGSLRRAPVRWSAVRRASTANTVSRTSTSSVGAPTAGVRTLEAADRGLQRSNTFPKKRSHAAPPPTKPPRVGRWMFEGPWEAAGGAAEACGRLSYSCVVGFYKIRFKAAAQGARPWRKTSFYKSQNNCKDKLCKPFVLIWPPDRLLKHTLEHIGNHRHCCRRMQACSVDVRARLAQAHQAAVCAACAGADRRLSPPQP